MWKGSKTCSAGMMDETALRGTEANRLLPLRKRWGFGWGPLVPTHLSISFGELWAPLWPDGVHPPADFLRKSSMTKGPKPVPMMTPSPQQRSRRARNGCRRWIKTSRNGRLTIAPRKIWRQNFKERPKHFRRIHNNWHLPCSCCSSNLVVRQVRNNGIQSIFPHVMITSAGVC